MTNPASGGGRNDGIDLLRLFSAFLVVILHVMGKGGVNAALQGAGKGVAYLVAYVPAYCAVNCFAIISGYVGYSDQPREKKYSRYMVLWLQVAFYCLLYQGIHWIVNPSAFGLKALIRTLMPVTFGTYWYFTAYTGVFFLSPWLNLLVAKSDKAQLDKLMLTLLLLFSCYVTLVKKFADPMNFNNGYSFLRLMLLYIVGAWMKKRDIPSRVSGRRAALGGGLMILLTWSSLYCIPWLLIRIFGRGERYARLLLSYCSPTIVGLAIAHVICFSKIWMGERARRAVRFLSPAAFGAYLAHVHPLVFHNLIGGSFRSIAAAPAWQIPLRIWGAALGVFALSLAIEKLREGLFRLARVPALCDRFEARMRTWASRLLPRGD